jgi:hypothetical protein
MKLLQDMPARQRRRRKNLLGFTLAEMMVTAAIFFLAYIAMVTVQIFGLRVYTLSSTKLIATNGGRKVMNNIRDPIRSASSVIVGFYTNSFSAIPSGSLQIGNAIQIYPPTNSVVTNNYIIFYQNPASSNLCYVTNNITTVLADFVTNYLCFQAEDYQGNILSNYLNNPVIRVELDFNQWEFPVIGGGFASAYDCYHLRTRVTRRVK